MKEGDLFWEEGGYCEELHSMTTGRSDVTRLY